MPKYEKYPDESQEEADIRISNAMDRVESYQLGGMVKPPTEPSIKAYKKGGKA